MRHRRRQNRDAEGVEGVGIWDGCLSPQTQPTRSSGGGRDLPQPGPGGTPAAKALSAIFESHRTLSKGEEKMQYFSA